MTKQELKTELKKELPWYIKFLAEIIAEILLKILNKKFPHTIDFGASTPLNYTPLYPQDGSEVDSPNNIKD